MADEPPSDGTEGPVADRARPDGKRRAAVDPPPDVEEDADRTALVRDLFQRIPFHRHHDIEVLVVTPRRAETKLPFADHLLGDPEREAIHGGVISSIVDHTGAAVFCGHCGTYTPTVNVRVDYLEAAGPAPLFANATVERVGRSIGVARVTVESGDTVCATGTGVYRLTDDD